MNVKDILQYLGVAALGIFAYSFIRNLYSTQETIIEGMTSKQEADIAKAKDQIKGQIEFYELMMKNTGEIIGPLKPDIEDLFISASEMMQQSRILSVYELLNMHHSSTEASKKRARDNLNKINQQLKDIEQAMEALEAQ